ncbi:MAG: TolC family protein [Acidimicrobiia bacterium]|nr:TolC family protein [Acidimicrobiia bacterium]NNF64192.1 TolC family protein [Acidimicrobiia bacterium]
MSRRHGSETVGMLGLTAHVSEHRTEHRSLRHGTRWLCLISSLALVACKTVDPTEQLDSVRALEAERGGRLLVWEQSQDDASLIAIRLDALLHDGLTRDDAATIAVLNNRTLQAEYEALGLAAAEVLQAELPSNPTLRGAVLFPVSAGDSSLGLMAWLSDLWLIPTRKDVASLRSTSTELKVAQMILATAHEAIAAWDGVVCARRMAQVARELEDALHHRSELIRQLYDNGFVDKVEWTSAVEDLLHQSLVARRREYLVQEAAARLAVALSLEGAAERVPENATLVRATIDDTLSVAALLDEAMSRRLDLMDARVAVQLTARRLDLERALVWRSVSVGVSYEGDFESVASDAQNPLGPTFSIEIPIFDQNQAGIAAANFRLRRATKTLAAARHRARAEVVTAWRAWQMTAAQLDTIEGDLNDTIEMTDRYARTWNDRIDGSYLDVLGASARRLRLDALWIEKVLELNGRQLQLERAVLSG